MPKTVKRETTGMENIADILLKYSVDNSGKYVTREFQDYGYRLALELDDAKRVSMYIKFAKTIDRHLLEAARSFVKDATHAKNKSRLFMWKLKQLKTEREKKESSSSQ